MKVACDRCLKIIEADSREYDDWLILMTTWGEISILQRLFKDVLENDV